MTRESPPEESIISTSLSSIIRKSLRKQESTVNLYDESRPALKRQIQSLERQIYRDQKIIDNRKEVLRLWSKAIIGYELLSTLADRIDTNPFPEQRMIFGQIAVSLMPDVKIGLWPDIFCVYELDPFLWYQFPVAAEDFDISKIECELWELLAGREALPVFEVRGVLPWEVHSKTYRTVKGKLQQRGWVWKSVKREGIVRKEIVAPKR